MVNLSQHEHYLFKCKNCDERWLFIDAVCEKIYYQDNDINKTYKLTMQNNNQFTFKYKPIYFHIKYDHEAHSSEWFHVPISIDKYKHKFLLSIQRDSSFVIKMSDLLNIANFIVKDYFELIEFDACNFANEQIEYEIKDMIVKYFEIDNATPIDEKDQQVISKHGLPVVCIFGHSVTPVLNGIDCTKKSQKNNHNYNQDSDVKDDVNAIDNTNIETIKCM